MIYPITTDKVPFTDTKMNHKQEFIKNKDSV